MGAVSSAWKSSCLLSNGSLVRVQHGSPRTRPSPRTGSALRGAGGLAPHASVSQTQSPTEMMLMKRLLSGNEAVARGAWEAGVKVAAAYPAHPAPRS